MGGIRILVRGFKGMRMFASMDKNLGFVVDCLGTMIYSRYTSTKILSAILLNPQPSTVDLKP